MPYKIEKDIYTIYFAKITYINSSSHVCLYILFTYLPNVSMRSFFAQTPCGFSLNNVYKTHHEIKNVSVIQIVEKNNTKTCYPRIYRKKYQSVIKLINPDLYVSYYKCIF